MPSIEPIKSVNVAGTVHPLDKTFTLLSGITTVAGNGNSGSYKSVRWYVSGVEGVTTPYNGMKIAIKVPLSGVGTAGAVLSINGNTEAEYHPLAYNVNTVLTTHFPVNSIKVFIYDANQTMDAYLASNTKKTITGVWKAESNYDINTTYTIASGDSNGQIKVTPSSGTAYNVDVKGLGAAAYKAIDTSVTSGSANLVTSGAVYTAINNLPEPMVFKGTLGTGGTITTLPTASKSEGYTYKVITAGTYASQSAKVGDVFVSNGSAWVLIPAGDDVEDTWRNIKVNDNELLGTGISTGAVNFKNGGNITVTGSGNNITLGVTSGYSIPSTTNQTAWSAKYDKPSGGIPDSDLASTFIKKVNNSTPDSNGNVSLNFLKSGDYEARIPYLTSNATIALTSDIPVTKYTQSTVNLYSLADGRYINSTENDITMYYHPLHTCIKKWKPGDILYIKFHRFYLLTQGSNSLCIVFGAANDIEDFAWCNSAMNLDTIPQVHESMKEFGNESTPVYLSRDTNYGPFRFKKCKLYGGGTGIVKLNGYDTLGKTYDAIFAPETAGEAGQFLKSNGSRAPVWADLATVATSGSYNDLTDTPTIPTATTVSNWGFTKNVGTVTSVSAGTGLSISGTSTINPTVNIASGYKLLTTSEYNTLNAKQDKISVGTNGQLLSSNGSSLVWTNDNRSLLHHDLGVIIENTTTDKGWKMFNSTINGFLLKSVRFNADSPVWGVGDFGAGIVFGGGDTKGVVSVAYRTPDIKIAGGNGSGPRWWIGLTGTSAKSYNLDKLNTIPTRVTGSWTVSTTNPGSMVDIILDHPDIKIYYKTYTSTTRRTTVSSVLFNASHNVKQGIYSLSLKYLNESGNLTTIGAGTIYYEYFK